MKRRIRHVQKHSENTSEEFLQTHAVIVVKNFETLMRDTKISASGDEGRKIFLSLFASSTTK